MVTTTPSIEKRRGAFYTPRSLADFLAGWAIRDVGDRALDPACGEAVFLEAAIARLHALGARPTENQIVGYEFNAETAAEARRVVPVANVIEANFFERVENGSPFEAVIGNPPWIRYHYFSGEARAQALACTEREGVALSQLTSSWAPFVVHATTFLTPGGRMALVLPAELLSTDYAAPIRDFLERRFATVQVITFEERIFPGALVDAVLVLGEGRGPGKVRVQRLRDADALRTVPAASETPTPGLKWTHALIKPEVVEALSVASEQDAAPG